MKIINIVLVASLFLLIGCLEMKVEQKELQRLASPDGRVDAVYITRDAGATTSIAHLEEVVGKIDKAVFIADHTVNLSFRWIESRRLAITYSEARVFSFRNFWLHGSLDNYKYKVKITETEQTIARNG